MPGQPVIGLAPHRFLDTSRRVRINVIHPAALRAPDVTVSVRLAIESHLG
jgi:hypothetical protein